MRAMIFAAGLGTRLKPFTLEHPKALVPLGGVPMLERVILKLKSLGVEEIVVNVHHFAYQIVDFLSEHSDFGCKIHISDESSLLLDTGGGILAARRWLDRDGEPFIVHNADIYTDFDLASMAKAHLERDAAATLLVADRRTSRYLLFDQQMRMHGWENVSTGAVRPDGLDPGALLKYAFGGVHVISPRIFEPLSQYKEAGVPFSIIDFYIAYCRDLDINGYLPREPYMWHDIGKPESLAEAERAING